MTQDTGYDKDRTKRQAFAIFAKRKRAFEKQGISEKAFWMWSLGTQDKDYRGSRDQFDVRDWTLLAARLCAIENNPFMLKALCEQIKTESNCSVTRVNRDQTEKQVYSGIFDESIFDRCKDHARATGCTVKLHVFGKLETFTP